MDAITRKKSTLNLATLTVYGILLILGILHHEMWMDESHHWLVASESSGISDLFYNYRYDGHPILWVLIMHLYSLISDSVQGIQFVHGLIALAAGWALIKASPFRWIITAGMLFSYFSLYEYGVLMRNYSLLSLSVFLLAYYWKDEENLGYRIWLLLGLIANTHLFGTIFSAVFGGIYLLKHRHLILSMPKRLGGVSLFIIAVGYAMWTILPPMDHPSVGNVSLSLQFDHIADVSMMLFKSLLPLPDMLNPFPWNNNALTSHLKWLIAPLALASWFLPLMFRWNRRWLLAVWYITALLIITFCLLTQLNPGIRYGGTLLVFLVGLLFIDQQSSDNSDERFRIPRRMATGIISTILSIQVLSAAIMFAYDIDRPFSSTKEIGELLQSNNLSETPIVSNAFCNAISVRNYSDKSVYFVNINQSMDFCLWNYIDEARGMDQQYDLTTSVTAAKTYMKTHDLPQVILLYHRDDIFNISTINTADLSNTSYLGTYNNGIVKRENFSVYLIK